MALALRAESIDAFDVNRHHANVDLGWTIALAGLQVMAPTDRFDDAKAAMRTRRREAGGGRLWRTRSVTLSSAATAGRPGW